MSKKEKWEIEPDYLHCIDQETGYFYYIYRDPEFKHLCGYDRNTVERQLY